MMGCSLLGRMKGKSISSLAELHCWSIHGPGIERPQWRVVPCVGLVLPFLGSTCPSAFTLHPYYPIKWEEKIFNMPTGFQNEVNEKSFSFIHAKKVGGGGFFLFLKIKKLSNKKKLKTTLVIHVCLSSSWTLFDLPRLTTSCCLNYFIVSQLWNTHGLIVSTTMHQNFSAKQTPVK